MSFYRNILTAFAAVAIAAPVFADDNMMQNPADDNAAQQTVTQQTTTTTTSSIETTKINLNKASAKDLMKVKGINASKARAIIAYRKKHGDFSNVEDLLKVKGFKKLKHGKFQEIEDQVAVD